MKGKMTPAEVTAYGVQPSLPVESALHVAAVLEAAAAELVVVVATEDEDPELVGVAEVDTTMGGTKVSLGFLEARAKRTDLRRKKLNWLTPTRKNWLLTSWKHLSLYLIPPKMRPLGGGEISLGPADGQRLATHQRRIRSWPWTSLRPARTRLLH